MLHCPHHIFLERESYTSFLAGMGACLLHLHLSRHFDSLESILTLHPQRSTVMYMINGNGMQVRKPGS